MTQKIVIKMPLHDDKRRSKAMKIASMVTGVVSVKITGEGSDQVEVVGKQIDSTELTRAMRKKVCPHASLALVEPVKPKDDDKAKEDLLKYLRTQGPPYYQYPPYNYIYEYNPSPPSCSIM